MASDFSVTLKNGISTQVSFVSSLKELSRIIGDCQGNVLLVADDNSAYLVPDQIKNRVILPPGERYKTWQAVERIVSAALDAHLARDSVMIALGGGVVCDITALSASLYMRGCRLILVPTTLLCMVDASLGGKTAIDFEGGKNLIGTFYPAERVLVAPQTLDSLPESEYISGLGEVLKHAFLSGDEELYDFLHSRCDRILSRDSGTLVEMLGLSLHVKASYIERDPEEKKGIRQALNLGHTFAHALESIEDFGISHGIAVAWGVSRAVACSQAKGLVDDEFVHKADDLLRMYGYDIDMRVAPDRWDDFIAAVGKDKKRASGSVRFVLLEGFGKPVLTPLEDELVRSLVVQGA